jgi:hypothetical protein
MKPLHSRGFTYLRRRNFGLDTGDIEHLELIAAEVLPAF